VNLDATARRLGNDGVTAEAHISYDGPVRAILDAVEHRDAGIIVMSTHGRSGLGRMVYGSIADQVLRLAEVPVLLVPATADHAWPTDRPLLLLVPLDGSEWSESALGALDTLPLARTSGAEIRLLRAIEPPVIPLYGDSKSDVPFDEIAERAVALSYLTSVAARLAERGYTACVDVVLGSASATIADVVHDRDIDLIVMATHGRSGLSRAVLGGVTAATIQRASVPILLTRPIRVQIEAATEPGQVTPDSELECTEARPVVLSLSAGERDLVQTGLTLLLAASEREEHHAAPIHAILARISHADSDQSKEAVATAH
jgi:nucleotide-binding universal stress UspA family protein